MLHPVLTRLIGEQADLTPEMQEHYSKLCEKISNYFYSYERDIKILEHASNIAHEDYEKVNKSLQQLNKKLKEIAEVSTSERDIMAQFPFENPSPVFRLDAEGNIEYMNPASTGLKEIEYNKKVYQPADFFKVLHKRLAVSGQIEFKWSGKDFLFNYKQTANGSKINFYGTDVSELTSLQQKSYENFYRLSNFLESTDAVHYIIYKNKKENNFFTSRWPTFFGFNPTRSIHPFDEKKNCVLPDSMNDYEKALAQLENTGTTQVRYQIRNQLSNRRLWIEEEVKKKYDPYIDDEVIVGKMVDVTQNELYKAAVEETENRFKNITESMPVMLWVSDMNNKVIYSNKGTKDFFGKGLEDFKDPKEFEAIIHPDYLQHENRHWYEYVENQQPISQEFLIKNKEGQYRFLQERAMPRFMAGGEFIGYIGAFFDLTNEYEYNLQLEKDKKQFELISLNSNDVVVITNKKGIINYVSPSITRVLGYAVEEVQQQILFDYMCLECQENLQERVVGNAFEKEELMTFSFRLVRKEGNEIWSEGVVTPVKQSNNQELIWHIRDVHQQHLSMEALQRSEEKYRTIFQNMSLGIIQVDANEKITFVNEAMETITGYAADEMLGQLANELLLKKPEHKQKLLEVLEERKKGASGIYEIAISNKKGEERLLVVSGVPQFDEAGNFQGSTGINWDVTEIRKIEQRLQEERINREKEVFEATLQAEEEQRAVIGRDLHDGVGQMLAYMTLYINMIKAKGNYTLHEIGELEKSVKHTLEQVRTLSRTLTPPAIRDLGLRDAVIELVNSYGILQKPVFNLKVYSQELDVRVAMDKKHVIYRVIQELLNNAFKYADANTIQLELKVEENIFQMLYADDGKGFDTKKIKKGVGLDSMRSRIRFHNGDIAIQTAPGKGVKIQFKIPLS